MKEKDTILSARTVQPNHASKAAENPKKDAHSARTVSTARAAAIKQVVEDRIRMEALHGALIFRGKSDSDAEKEAEGIFDRERRRRALTIGFKGFRANRLLRRRSVQYLQARTWADFLCQNIEWAAPGNPPLEADKLYRCFVMWFELRNPDVIAAPSQTLFGKYMNHSGFARKRHAGRVRYLGIRLAEERGSKEICEKYRPTPW